MRAIGRVDFVESGEAGASPQPVITRLVEGDPQLEVIRKAARYEAERLHRIRRGLLDLYNLDPTKVKEFKRETGTLKRRLDGVDVPEESAQLTHTDVTLTDGTEVSFTALVDAKTRIDEDLTTDLGVDAERDAARGDFFSDVITPESDKYYNAARTETELYRSAQLARAAGAAALLMPPSEKPENNVIPIWPGAQDGQPFTEGAVVNL